MHRLEQIVLVDKTQCEIVRHVPPLWLRPESKMNERCAGLRGNSLEAVRSPN